MDFSFSGLRTLLIVPTCFSTRKWLLAQDLNLNGQGRLCFVYEKRNIFESPLDVFLVIFFASRNSIFFIDAHSFIFGVTSY